MYNIKANISLDLLEVSYTTAKETRQFLEGIPLCYRTEGNEVSLFRLDSKSYQHTFEVSVAADYDSENDRWVFRNIGTLYFGSHNANRKDIYLRWSNEALYDPYLLSCRYGVESFLNLSFKCVSKLDIAADINLNLVRRFYRAYRDPDYEFILFGRAYKDMDTYVWSLVNHSSGTRQRPFKEKSFSLTSTSEDKGLGLRCYDKNVEKMYHSSKDYITTGRTAFRLEASCRCHKQVQRTLQSLGVVHEEELYAKLQDENFLWQMHTSTLNRICRVRYRRKTYSLLAVLLFGEEIKGRKI